MKEIAIETPIGILFGRDAIFLDKSESTDYALTFTGECRGETSGQTKREFYPYRLTFEGLISYFACENDTYEAIQELRCPYASSFSAIEDSPYLEKLPIRRDFDKKEYTHYRFQTYDTSFDILAKSYKLEIKTNVL